MECNPAPDSAIASNHQCCEAHFSNRPVVTAAPEGDPLRIGTIGKRAACREGRFPGLPRFLVSDVDGLQRSPWNATTHVSWDGTGDCKRFPRLCRPTPGAVGGRGRGA